MISRRGGWGNLKGIRQVSLFEAYNLVVAMVFGQSDKKRMKQLMRKIVLIIMGEIND